MNYCFFKKKKMLILISISILDMELDLIGYRFFLHLNGETGRNVIILGVDMTSSTKIDNRGKKYFNS